MQDRPRRLAGHRDPDRRERCSAGRSSRWRWSATSADNCIIVCSIENVDPMGVHTGDSHHRRPGADADRQGIPDDAQRLDRGAARDRRRDRRLQRPVRRPPRDRPHGRHRDEPPRLPLLGAGLQGHRLPDRQDRRQARRRLHPRRARQRHHPGDARLLRADHRLRRHQDPALRLREVPRRRAAAHHRDEVGRRGHGHRPHLPREPCRRRSARSRPASPASTRSTSPAPTAPTPTPRSSSALSAQTPDRLRLAAQAMRHGLSDDEIHASTSYDPWFLARIREIVDEEARLRADRPAARDRTRSAA